jgi:hypothetical protein
MLVVKNIFTRQRIIFLSSFVIINDEMVHCIKFGSCAIAIKKLDHSIFDQFVLKLDFQLVIRINPVL